MNQALAPVQHPLPTRVQQAILAYGFTDREILSKVVASRKQGDRSWLAVLLHDVGEGYWAIELEYLDGRWEIVSDSAGPFEDVQDFQNRRVATCLR